MHSLLRLTRLTCFAGALLMSCSSTRPASAPKEPPHEPAAAPTPASPASSDTNAPPAPAPSAAASSTPAAARTSLPAGPPSVAWTDCRVEPLPVRKAPPPARACLKIAPNLEKTLKPKLAKPYDPPTTGATIVVNFACDPLEKAREIVIEGGSGHGQNLALVRLRPHGRTISALRITRPGMFATSAPAALVERAELDGGALEAHLPEIRALLLAALTERIPPDSNDISESFSSNDWHGLIRVEDEAGRSIERSFTGYESSTAQLKTIPIVQIDAILGPILEAIPWQEAPVDSDARAFFVDRFVAAGPEGAEWWVKERLIMLASSLGTPALVPKLVGFALASGGDASVQRTRGYAVDALASLAGFDARHDEKGALVPVEAAAAAYARACRAPAP